MALLEVLKVWAEWRAANAMRKMAAEQERFNDFTIGGPPVRWSSIHHPNRIEPEFGLSAGEQDEPSFDTPEEFATWGPRTIDASPFDHHVGGEVLYLAPPHAIAIEPERTLPTWWRRILEWLAS